MTNKYQTFVPATFNQAELDSRVTKAKGRVHQNKLFTSHAFAGALEQIEALTAEGWKLDIKGYTPVAVPLNGMIDFQFLMTKPAKLIKAEQATAAQQAETEYKAEIEAEQALALERMTARILGERKDKLEKEEQARQAEEQELAHQLALEALDMKEVV